MEKLDLVTVATFATVEEAGLARGMLAEEGIRAVLEGEATVGMLWYLGNAVGGIKLQVAAEEADRAKNLLGRKVADEASPSGAGPCSRCGAEREPGFAACWSCGAIFGAAESPAPAPATALLPETAGEAARDTEEEPSETRPGQFSLREVLMFMAVCAFLLGFFIGFYPHSATMLPCLLLYPIALLWRRGGGHHLAALVTASCLYVFLTLLAGAAIENPEDFHHGACTNNLKRISFALHNYHERYGSFPPPYIPDDHGKPMHSWRVLILPWLEEETLHRQYRFDEPWNGPNNSKLGTRLPWAYQCPADKHGGLFTSYLAVTGPGTMWDGSKARTFADIKDGTSQTIAVVETANSGIHWMEPRDLDIQAMEMSVNPAKGTGISSRHREITWHRRWLGANVALADGSVRRLPPNTPAETLYAMLTIAGGEEIALDKKAR